METRHPEMTGEAVAQIRFLLDSERHARTESIANAPPEEEEDPQTAAPSAAQLLAQVEAAIARIDDGTYGFCKECGDAIPLVRLEVLPSTTTCVRCAARMPSQLIG